MLIPRLREKLLSLLEVPSPSGYESKLVERIVSFVEELKIPYELQRVEGQRCNVIVNPGAEVLVNTHLDTVAQPFVSPKVCGDLILGTGAADAKASVAILLQLLEELGKPSFTVGFFVDEERAGKGSKVYAEKWGHEFSLTLEPTDLRLCTAGGGSVELEFLFRGDERHGSFSLGARNPVVEASSFVCKLKELEAKRTELSHEKLGRPHINVQSFVAANEELRIPPECRVVVEAMLMPGEEPEGLIGEIASLANTSYRVLDISLGFESDGENPHFGELQRALMRAGLDPSPGGFRSWCDAQHLHEAGSFVAIFGPGKPELSHTRDEHISLKDVAKAYNIIKAFSLELEV